MGVSRDNKNSYTSATGAGGAGRDRDLRRSDLGSTPGGILGKDNVGREERPDNRNRDFQRTNTEGFDKRNKFGRELNKENNKDQWSDNSRGDGNRSADRRSDERGNSGTGFEQRREGQNIVDRDRRGSDRGIAQRDPDKNLRGAYDRTPPPGSRTQRGDWNRSPVGERSSSGVDRNRDNWEDGGNAWNRDRGLSPLSRRSGGRQRAGGNSLLSGANSVPVKSDLNSGNQRREKSPLGGRERSERSRSSERLLPPQVHSRSSAGDNRDYTREDRRSGHERDRSPRIDRNSRSSGEHFERKRSPRDGNRGSLDRISHPRRDRDRGNDNFDDRHYDKDRHKGSASSSNLLSRMDRSRSREARVGDGKYTEATRSKTLRSLDRGNFLELNLSYSNE